jgi:PAS domain S-box-containing protein
MRLDASAGHPAAKARGNTSGRSAVATSLAWPEREDDQTEAAPLESERLFQVAFERAVIGIAHISPEGRFLRFNQRLCDFLGYDRAELAARTLQDVTYPEDFEPCAASFQRLLAGEIDEYEMDKRSIRKDGTPVWAHVAVSLVRTPEGAPDFTVTMIQDITERKRLEQERARLLERERAARAQVEATNAQLHVIQALTDTALSHLALDDLLREVLGRVTGVMGVDQVGILLLDEDDRTLVLRAASGLLEAAPGYDRFAMGQGFPGRIAASRESLIVNAPSADDLDGAPPELREWLHSAAGVPLLVEDPIEDQAATHPASRLVGVLVVGSAAPRRFAKADLQLLQRAADRIALAVDRARLYAAEQDARRCAEEARTRAQASEMQATERAERLRTILETMADGVAVYDAAGRPIQLVNRAYRELFALERGPTEYEDLTTGERMTLLDVRDAATGAVLPFEATPVGRALRGEVVTGPGADVRARAFDGRALEVNNSAAPLRDSNGQIVGVVVVLRDMSERNRLAREREAARADELSARETSRRMEAFLATAAHDLRTPLTAVVGYLYLARRTSEQLAATALEANPALAPAVLDMRARLGEAGQGADRLARLLTLLFDTAALRAGKLELHRAPCDLVALVHEQVEALHMAAPDRTIRLHVPAGGATDDDPIPGFAGTPDIPVEVDADRIGQVVTNYLTNALKYSPPDRPVDVSVVARGGRTRVLVCDHGQGIAKHDRAPIWELFHRVPGVTVQNGAPGGTTGGSLGLGLHISRAIIAAHGGRVGVRSAVGGGSTFWFTLPLSSPTSGPADVAP